MIEITLIITTYPTQLTEMTKTETCHLPRALSLPAHRAALVCSIARCDTPHLAGPESCHVRMEGRRATRRTIEVDIAEVLAGYA